MLFQLVFDGFVDKFIVFYSDFLRGFQRPSLSGKNLEVFALTDDFLVEEGFAKRPTW